MPRREQTTLITWIPGSDDGKREATNLHGVFPQSSVLKPPGKLEKQELGFCSSLILVGHRSELNSAGGSLLDFLTGSDLPWLVLANCHSGVAQNFGPLEQNELQAPGQILANSLKIKVSATVRPLTFDEVGKAGAFTLGLGDLLIRIDPPGGGLWQDFSPQQAVDALADRLSNI